MPDPDRRPILCLDFDGVLHSYSSGWRGVDVAGDPPVPGAAEFLEHAIEVGFRIAVNSSRSRDESGRACMSNYVWRLLSDRFDVRHAERLIGEIDFPAHKPPAFVTLDDRAVTFTGTFPDPAALLAFRPWTKQETI